jgi:hypothetical protein
MYKLNENNNFLKILNKNNLNSKVFDYFIEELFDSYDH